MTPVDLVESRAVEPLALSFGLMTSLKKRRASSASSSIRMASTLIFSASDNSMTTFPMSLPLTLPLPVLLLVFPFPLCLPFETVPLLALLAQLPDDTLWPILAIGAGVRTGLTILQTLPAVAYSHFLALNICLAVRVISTLHRFFSLPLPALNTPPRGKASCPYGAGTWQPHIHP
jgi:hypothetical protein